MKRLGKFSMIKGSFFLLLLFGLVLFSGCSSDSGGKSGEEGGSSSDSADLTSFQTTDIYGEEKDQSIFEDYTLTMVNIWGTFCPPCLEEMPYLGEIQKEYEPKGVNLVGIVVDVQDMKLAPIEDQITLAKEIAEETGADYTHLLISEEILDSVVSRFDSIPVTFFVDSTGKIVSEIYVGGREKKDWVDIIEETLKNQES